jgi:hypothetical protein
MKVYTSAAEVTIGFLYGHIRTAVADISMDVSVDIVRRHSGLEAIRKITLTRLFFENTLG